MTAERDNRDDRPVEWGEELRYLRSGVHPGVLQKLRRGKFAIEDTLDLHGLTVEEARIELKSFLEEAEALHHAAVRIIHGKGYRSAGRQPVLKTKVNQWLRAEDAVLAFCSSRPEHGGTGSVDVLLESGRDETVV